MTHPLGFATRSLHVGEPPEQPVGALSVPIVLSTNFVTTPDRSSFSAVDLKENSPYFYGRWGTPTVRALEIKLADLEGAEDALCFATGMAAATALLLGQLNAGDHLIMSDVCYAGVAEFARYKLPRLGIEVTMADVSDLHEVEKLFRPNTRLVWAESPVNPILRLCDVAALSEIAHRRGAALAMDSTLATPYSTQPLKLGADWVVHSLTKYINGHGDVLGGAVLGSRSALAELRRDGLIHLGSALSPFDAWLTIRGLHTLPLRMERHQSSALKVATFLEHNPAVRRIIYPGLKSHPQYALACRQMTNFSGMLTMQVVGDGARAARLFAERARTFSYAVSLGKQKSLMIYISTDDICRTSFGLEGRQLESYRAFAGDGIFRISIGLEDPDDLIEDVSALLAGL